MVPVTTHFTTHKKDDSIPPRIVFFYICSCREIHSDYSFKDLGGRNMSIDGSSRLRGWLFKVQSKHF
jgi:hypothetical protein